MQSLADLMDILPQRGTVTWIGLRPAKRAPMQAVDRVLARAGHGLDGDRYAKVDGDRQVTLIQAEHLDALGSLLGTRPVAPELVRRNLVVRGINLLALKNRRFRLGAALLEHTGPAHPCSRMEAALGPGGYNAMRGHGGITARVVESGSIELASALEVLSATSA
jgi:MOSC domain-containing protein YiiM